MSPGRRTAVSPVYGLSYHYFSYGVKRHTSATDVTLTQNG
jgi:hypothetical protein